MPNLDKAARQHRQQKTAPELDRVECHDLLPVAVGRIAPAKGDLAVFEPEKTALGDRHAMGIVSQIPNDRARPGKRLLGVDDPPFLFQQPGEASKGFPLLPGREGAGEPPPASAIGTAQPGEELALELRREHRTGKKEVPMAARDPAGLVESQAARGHQTMQRRMSLQSLIPGMEDRQKAEPCPEMLRIGRDGQQGWEAARKSRL